MGSSSLTTHDQRLVIQSEPGIWVLLSSGTNSIGTAAELNSSPYGGIALSSHARERPGGSTRVHNSVSEKCSCMRWISSFLVATAAGKAVVVVCPA